MMSLLFLFIFVLGIWGVAGAPSNWRFVTHEKRDVYPEGWVKHSKLHPERFLPLKVALKQENIDKLDSYLMSVSHPDSKDFGKHFTHQEIAKTFAPNQETVEEVHRWLVSAGISEKRINLTPSRGWLHFNATVKEAEVLLRTEFHLFKHSSGQSHVACDKYSVPEHIQPHIDFITPTVHFDVHVRTRDTRVPREKRNGAGFGWKKPSPPKWAPVPKPIPTHFNVANCSSNITPDCLRALYGIPVLDPKTRPNSRNSFGVVEYTPQSYNPFDMDMFFGNYSKNQVQKRPTLRSVDGGDIYATNDINQMVEANLDLQYAMALVNPLNVTLYQVGDLIETDFTSFNNFLDAIDGSYCSDNDNTDNTTSPTVDAIYPDPLPGGYSGPRNCGGYAATRVISTSYSYNEHDLTPAYEIRQCNEYAKLGLQGISALYCSGDYGVAGSGGRCINPDTGDLGSEPGGKFAPSFPSTCPYVLSVGATQIRPNASVTEPEIACATRISSGGGFSNVFSMPSYQSNAVKQYFKHHPPQYGADRFNNSGKMRGYPDVSANGAKYVVALNGAYDYLLYGTSASTPTFAAVIALINEARMNIGKGSVGFINPTLYQHPELLFDITSGTNPGCGTDGFTAVPGWDPVTGLGTPNYPKMLQYFLTH